MRVAGRPGRGMVCATADHARPVPVDGSPETSPRRRAVHAAGGSVDGKAAGGHQIRKVMPTLVPDPSSLAVIDSSEESAAISWMPSPSPGVTRFTRGTIPQPWSVT